MKNHIKSNGKLIQTNKKWSNLKEHQKQFISNLIREKCIELYKKEGKTATNAKKVEIRDFVYYKMEEREIWLPYGEFKSIFDKKFAQYERKNMDTYLNLNGYFNSADGLELQKCKNTSNSEIEEMLMCSSSLLFL